jgi:hypothetical protein
MHEELMGKRYIGLVRCSTDGQKDTSIPDQLALLRGFADKHGMIHVDDVLRGGVSGSKPGNRTDLDELVARKRDRNDYDILLVQDTTRLTRGGVEHGAKIEFEFTKVGVRIVFVADQLPDGDFGGVVRSFLYFSGKQTAKSTSLFSTRGCMSSLEQGRSAHCRRPPYGTDKAYVAPDGSWLHVIRTMPNGTQLKLDAKTGAVIGTFGKNEATLRRLMEILIGRLEVDLETLDVDMELRLPSWAMANAQSIKNAMGLTRPFAVKTERQAHDAEMGLDGASAIKTERQTHREDSVLLARFSCARRPTCFECRRRAA